MKTRKVEVIEDDDWDALVKKTYGRPYKFQQQDGCRDRGTVALTVPTTDTRDNDMHDSIPETVVKARMGVKFAVWLARDPQQKIRGQRYDWELETFWERNFYPDLHTVANDLHAKGLLPAGEYLINIDW